MLVSNGRGGQVEEVLLPILVGGTMITTDMEAARKFYEEVLGLECVEYAPRRLLLRDRFSKREMEKGGSSFVIIEVAEVDKIDRPQVPINHWGLSVESPEQVDRVRAALIERSEEFGIQKVLAITGLHGAYGFFFADRDMNWWEVEFRTHGRTNNEVFAEGDYDVAA